MPQHPRSINVTGFKGLNNISTPDNTPEAYLKKAMNVDIDKTGNISKRKGYTLFDSGNYSSLWSSENGLGMFAVKNGNLVRIDGTVHTLLSGIQNKLSFEEVDGKIYFSSPSENGIIDGSTLKSWGIPKNNTAPTLTIGQGSLPPGTYQVAFTYVTSEGLESGTKTASKITLNGTGGITLSIPSSSYPYSRVYCSTQNGDDLYFYSLVIPGHSVTIQSQSQLIHPLRTFNIDSPPLGKIIKYYKGRMYIAQDNILWYSEPFQYNHFRLNSNYIEFPQEIREVMPVEDGIWIGSDNLYYLSGTDPAKFNKTIKERVKVVEGTATRISGSYVHIDNVPIGYKWLVTTDLGIFMLFNQGMALNNTAQNVALEQASSGTSIFLQNEGMNQYLSILKTNQDKNNTVLGDLVEVTQISNGNIIP